MSTPARQKAIREMDEAIAAIPLSGKITNDEFIIVATKFLLGLQAQVYNLKDDNDKLRQDLRNVGIPLE